MKKKKKNEEPLNARQAAEYLREKWGLPEFSMNAFRQHRHRHKIKPSVYPEMSNSTLWTLEELDAIPEPENTKRRPNPGRTKDSDEGIDNSAHAMLQCVRNIA